MKLLSHRSTVQIRSILTKQVRPLFCQPVMQPEHVMGPHDIATRTLRSSFKDFAARTRPLGCSSVMEPLYIDKETGDEFDPRTHGYRVVYKSRGYSTVSAVSHGTTNPFEQPTVRNDEYSFIMSSPHPVSAEQCAQRRYDDDCPTQDQVDEEELPSVEDVLRQKAVLMSFTETSESSTSWCQQHDEEDPAADEMDLAIE